MANINNNKLLYYFIQHIWIYKYIMFCDKFHQYIIAFESDTSRQLMRRV